MSSAAVMTSSPIDGPTLRRLLDLLEKFLSKHELDNFRGKALTALVRWLRDQARDTTDPDQLVRHFEEKMQEFSAKLIERGKTRPPLPTPRASIDEQAVTSTLTFFPKPRKPF